MDVNEALVFNDGRDTNWDNSYFRFLSHELSFPWDGRILRRILEYSSKHRLIFQQFALPFALHLLQQVAQLSSVSCLSMKSLWCLLLHFFVSTVLMALKKFYLFVWFCCLFQRKWSFSPFFYSLRSRALSFSLFSNYYKMFDCFKHFSFGSLLAHGLLNVGISQGLITSVFFFWPSLRESIV